MRAKKTAGMLEDREVNIKVKLASLWIALMFFYVYNDIFSMYQPGHVAELLEGRLEGVQFTQTLLLGGAALLAFPILMIPLSLLVKARVNRIVNIIAGVFHILLLLGTQFVGEGETWHYWRLYEILEALLLVLIIWNAWRWPTTESLQQPSSPNPA